MHQQQELHTQCSKLQALGGCKDYMLSCMSQIMGRRSSTLLKWTFAGRAGNFLRRPVSCPASEESALAVIFARAITAGVCKLSLEDASAAVPAPASAACSPAAPVHADVSNSGAHCDQPYGLYMPGWSDTTQQRALSASQCTVRGPPSEPDSAAASELPELSRALPSLGGASRDITLCSCFMSVTTLMPCLL